MSSRLEQSCPPGSREYTVKPGDTLFLISQRFDVPLQDVIDANPQIENPDLIYPGQVVCVPKAARMPRPMPEWHCMVMHPMHPDVEEPGSALVRMMPGHVLMALMDMPKPHHFTNHANCYVGWVMSPEGMVRDSFELSPARANGLYIGHKDVHGMMHGDHLMVTAEYGSRMKCPEGEELLGADLMMEMRPGHPDP